MPDRDPALEVALKEYRPGGFLPVSFEENGFRDGWDAAFHSLGVGAPAAQEALRGLLGSLRLPYSTPFDALIRERTILENFRHLRATLETQTYEAPNA